MNMAFDHVTRIYNERFGVVITQGAFADLVVCLTEFSKNSKFQKKSLQAIETLKSTVTKMLRTPECPLSHRGESSPRLPEEGTNLAKQLTRQSQEEQFWYPILIAFQDVLMTGDDLEVRSRYGLQFLWLSIGSARLTSSQGTYLPLRYPYSAWRRFPTRLLGRPLAPVALPDLCGPAVQV